MVVWKCNNCEDVTGERWLITDTGSHNLACEDCGTGEYERIPVIRASRHEHTRQCFIKQTENAAEWRRRALKAEREAGAVEGLETALKWIRTFTDKSH